MWVALLWRESEMSLSSLRFSRSVMSDSLRHHEPQHSRPPCPSPTPGVHPSPCPSSQWWPPTISSSVAPFSSCLQSFPASGSFPVSQVFSSGGQSIGASVSVLVLFSIRSRKSHLTFLLWRNKPLIFYWGKSLFPTKHLFCLVLPNARYQPHPHPSPSINRFNTEISCWGKKYSIQQSWLVLPWGC